MSDLQACVICSLRQPSLFARFGALGAGISSGCWLLTRIYLEKLGRQLPAS